MGRGGGGWAVLISGRELKHCNHAAWRARLATSGIAADGAGLFDPTKQDDSPSRTAPHICKALWKNRPASDKKGGGFASWSRYPRKNSELLHVCTCGSQHKSADGKTAHRWPIRP